MRIALGWLPCMALARATSANESRATTASLPAGVLWGVGLAQSARVPVSNIDDGFSGSGPLGVGRREG